MAVGLDGDGVGALAQREGVGARRVAAGEQGVAAALHLDRGAVQRPAAAGDGAGQGARLPGHLHGGQGVEAAPAVGVVGRLVAGRAAAGLAGGAGQGRAAQDGLRLGHAAGQVRLGGPQQGHRPGDVGRGVGGAGQARLVAAARRRGAQAKARRAQVGAEAVAVEPGLAGHRPPRGKEGDVVQDVGRADAKGRRAVGGREHRAAAGAVVGRGKGGKDASRPPGFEEGIENEPAAGRAPGVADHVGPPGGVGGGVAGVEIVHLPGGEHPLHGREQALGAAKAVGGDPRRAGGDAHLVARAVVADDDAHGPRAVAAAEGIDAADGRGVGVLAAGVPPVVVVLEFVALVAPVLGHEGGVVVLHAAVDVGHDDARAGDAVGGPHLVGADAGNVPLDGLGRLTLRDGRQRLDRREGQVGVNGGDLGQASQRPDRLGVAADDDQVGDVVGVDFGDVARPALAVERLEHGRLGALGRFSQRSQDKVAARLPIADVVGGAQVGLVGEIDEEGGCSAARRRAASHWWTRGRPGRWTQRSPTRPAGGTRPARWCSGFGFS